MLSTYTDLKNAIPSWTVRPDLDVFADDFVQLALAQCNRDLDIEAMNKRVSLSTSSEFVALPADVKSVMNLYVSGNPNSELPYRTRGVIMDISAGSNTGTPSIYTIVGSDIQLAPAPASTISLYLDYKAAFPALSDSNPTNWLTINGMDALLYASLAKASEFIRDDEGAKMWAARYEQAIAELRMQDRKLVGGPLEAVPV